jgi:hypothetical protein
MTPRAPAVRASEIDKDLAEGCILLNAAKQVGDVTALI